MFVSERLRPRQKRKDILPQRTCLGLGPQTRKAKAVASHVCRDAKAKDSEESGPWAPKDAFGASSASTGADPKAGDCLLAVSCDRFFLRSLSKAGPDMDKSLEETLLQATCRNLNMSRN